VLIVSNSPSSVLLTGDSGTGKELFAKAIHFHGNRSSQPFVKVNCAAIPENLLEAELFGYVEGAFTGARKGGKLGKFELANKGTIFLDEIGEMPLPMQAKLLRVLQEGEIERVGGIKTIPIDVRIISATNKDLLSLIKEGNFREDLYYRLNVVNFHIPPLRERKSDIPLLINYIIQQLNKRLGRAILYPTQEAMELLLSYDWPGNIRELVNIIEAAMNFCRSSVIDIEDLPFFLNSYKDYKPYNNSQSLEAKVENAEKFQLISVLKQCNGNRKAAAEMLEISRTTLFRLMKKYELL
jgi:transcriptional regulator with PAS, ATPase and Fis domain